MGPSSEGNTNINLMEHTYSFGIDSNKGFEEILVDVPPSLVGSGNSKDLVTLPLVQAIQVPFLKWVKERALIEPKKGTSPTWGTTLPRIHSGNNQSNN